LVLTPCAPPAPLMEAAASSGLRPAAHPTETPSTSPAHVIAHQTSLVPCIEPPSPVQQSRRPPPLGAGAPLAGPLPAPTKHRNRTPRTRRTFSRQRPAGPGHRLAGFWPDRRRPVPRDPIASPQIFPGVHLRNKGIYVTL
jgi:hypothetical protein